MALLAGHLREIIVRLAHQVVELRGLFRLGGPDLVEEAADDLLLGVRPAPGDVVAGVLLEGDHIPVVAFADLLEGLSRHVVPGHLPRFGGIGVVGGAGGEFGVVLMQEMAADVHVDHLDIPDAHVAEHVRKMPDGILGEAVADEQDLEDRLVLAAALSLLVDGFGGLVAEGRTGSDVRVGFASRLVGLVRLVGFVPLSGFVFLLLRIRTRIDRLRLVAAVREQRQACQQKENAFHSNDLLMFSVSWLLSKSKYNISRPLLKGKTKKRGPKGPPFLKNGMAVARLTSCRRRAWPGRRAPSRGCPRCRIRS